MLKAGSLALLGLCLIAGACNPPPDEPGDPNVPPADAWVCAEGQGATGYVEAQEPVRDAEGRLQFIIKTEPSNPNLRSIAAASSVEAELGRVGLVNVEAHGFQAVGNQVRTLAGPGNVAPLYSGYGTEEQGRAAAELDGIVRVEVNGVKSIVPLAEPGASEGWGPDRINQRALPPDGNRDNGFGLGPEDFKKIHDYHLDTGCAPDDFEGNFGEAYNVFSGGNDASSGHNHGPSTASQVGSSKFGVAPGTTIHCVKVLSDQGSGSDLGVAEGIDWSTAHAQANGWPSVMSLSLGGGVSPSIDEAICRAIAAGVDVSVASGNSGPQRSSCDGSPSRVWEAATVGASDRNDNVADFSQQGGCTNIVGPGVCTESVGYSCGDGTSFGCPHVTGALVVYKAAGKTKQDLYDNATTGALKGVRGGADRLVYVGPETPEGGE